MGINVQVFADRQLGGRLNRPDKRVLRLNLPQLVDIRVKHCETDVSALLLCDHFGYTAYDFRTGPAKSY